MVGLKSLVSAISVLYRKRIRSSQFIGKSLLTILLLSSPAYNGFDFVIDAGQNLVKVEQDVLYAHRQPRQGH
jgi:hypothetical protein